MVRLCFTLWLTRATSGRNAYLGVFLGCGVTEEEDEPPPSSSEAEL